MVFGNGDAAIPQRPVRAVAVEPGRRDEAGNRTAGDILQQGAPAFDP